MRKPTFKYYRNKIKELIKDESKYLITGVFVIAAISTFTIIQFRNKNILGVFSFDASEDSPIAISDKTDDIMKILVTKTIDYVSPSINKEQRELSVTGISRPEENGQISAIASGRVTNTEDKYVVKPGDSLASIAQEVYGDLNAWVRIAQANNITNPDSVEVGMTLIIPR
jgi:LysM repeat protein